MGANPHANGGLLLRELELPDFRDYAVEVPAPGDRRRARRRGCSASFLRDVIAPNPDRFRIMGPDETASNRLVGRVRGDRPGVGGGAARQPTITSRPTAA